MNSSADEPIRIAFCITELDCGGAERALVELATRLDCQRFRPIVYCLGFRPLGNPTSLADVLEERGVSVVCFDARGAWDFPATVRRLTRVLRAQRPRIVQGFLFHGNLVSTLAGCWAGVPHILTGLRVAEREHRWHLKWARWTDRWVERHVCVSQAVRDFSRVEAGLSADKLLVIPNGVDLARFAAATPCTLSELKVSAGRRAIVCIGRLDKQKGVDWLLGLMPRVVEALPNHDLVIVGEGPQRAQLQSIVERLQPESLRGRIHFVGYRADVPEILAACDLLVLPSRWEGMPNVVLEAMASAKPVVATDVEGVRELLGDAAVEQIAPRGDAAEFVDCISRILRTPEMAERLGRSNRARVQRDQGWITMVRAYERLYESLGTEK